MSETRQKTAVEELTEWLNDLLRKYPDPHELSLPRFNRMVDSGTDYFQELISARPHSQRQLFARTWIQVIRERAGLTTTEEIAKILVDKGYFKQEA